ncbi:MAG: AraC family transcriptional regulator [Pseudomonadota bacterium]
MDALSDVLRASRLTGGVYLHAEFSEPWCFVAQVKPELCAPFALPARHLISFHYIVEGRMSVRVWNGPTIEVGTGEVVLLPRNDPHTFGSDTSLPPADVSKVIPTREGDGLFQIRHGGDGAVTKVVCGYLGSDDGKENPVIAALPQAFKLGVEEAGAAEWIRSSFQFAADAVAAGSPGSSTVLSKLSELLFVEAVRRYTEKLPDGETGWLAGLKDPYVSRALGVLHKDIAKEWTVDDLSREVGLSRSAFADRFSRLIGTSPKQYLTSWRMQRAAQLLQNSNRSVAQVAEDVGYDSVAAFSRAFKRVHDCAPATWRKAQLDEH